MNRPDFTRKIGGILRKSKNLMDSTQKTSSEKYDDDPSGDYMEPEILNSTQSGNTNNTSPNQLPYYLDMDKTKSTLEPPKPHFGTRPLTPPHIINRPPMPLPNEGCPSQLNKPINAKPKVPAKPAILNKQIKPPPPVCNEDESIYEVEPKIEERTAAPKVKPKKDSFIRTVFRNEGKVSKPTTPKPQSNSKTEYNSNEESIYEMEPQIETAKRPEKKINYMNNAKIQKPTYVPPPPPRKFKTTDKSQVDYHNFDPNEESIYEAEPQIEQINPAEKLKEIIKPENMNSWVSGQNNTKLLRPLIPPLPNNFRASTESLDSNEESIYELEPEIETPKQIKPMEETLTKNNSRAQRPPLQESPNETSTVHQNYNLHETKPGIEEIQRPKKTINNDKVCRSKVPPPSKNLKSSNKVSPNRQKNDFIGKPIEIKPKTSQVKEAPVKNYGIMQKPLQLPKQASVNMPIKKTDFNKSTKNQIKKEPTETKILNKSTKETESVNKKHITPKLHNYLKTQPEAKESIWNVSKITELPKPPPLTNQFNPNELNDFSSESSEEEIVPKVDPTQSRFYKNTDRKGTKALLQNRGDGAFLFRPSSEYKIVLTVVYNKQFHKLRIDSNHEDRLYCIGDEDNTFKTLDELAEYYKVNPLSVKANDGVKHLYLKDVL